MSKIFIIGVTEDGPTPQHIELLGSCELVVSGKRLAELLPPLSSVLHPITPIGQALDAIEQTLLDGNVAVLASGDPLFFGIGKRIIDHFGSEKVVVLPALSSMQLAFSRFALPWDDATTISLHGRDTYHIPGLLLAHPKTFVFTDSHNTPDHIAKKIINYFDCIGEKKLGSEYRLFVAENLGNNNEKITQGTLVEISQQSFSPLNVLCVLGPQRPQRQALGLCEHEIAHSRGLITKDEVRAATLHRLRLPRQGVLWDVGGGSGSISIEAASLNPELTIYTIERKEEELENIKKNIRRFSCFNILPIAGKAADVLDSLPDPDCVFIGGSGGELPLIIREAAKRMAPQGTLVVNGVIEKTLTEAPELMQQNGLSVETSRIEINRTGPKGPECFNPITIMVGRK